MKIIYNVTWAKLICDKFGTKPREFPEYLKLDIKWPDEREYPGDIGQELTKEEAMGWNACLRKCKKAYEKALRIARGEKERE